MCGYPSDNPIPYLEDYLFCHRLFYSKKLSKALQEFTKIKRSNPKDPVLLYYCELISYFIETGYDISGDLILDLQEK